MADDASVGVHREAASDRGQASQDRRAGAAERAQAERDRATASADRAASAYARSRADTDRSAGYVELGHKVDRPGKSGEPLVLAAQLRSHDLTFRYRGDAFVCALVG